jgi:Sulfotransferase family
MMKLPNFFIVGAPKAGTTSLYAYLDQHPQVYMSPLKEPSYFASELRVENFRAEMQPRLAREVRALQQYLHGHMSEKRFGGLVSNWEDYLKLYRNVSDEQAIGEATATYLWSPSAAANIATRIPHARIIINLRNPIDRAYSQYLQMLSAGAFRGSFRELIDASLALQDRRLGSVLEFGRYFGQIERYLHQFPRTQIHISYYEELQRSPQQLIAKLFTFLGVDPNFVPDVSLRHHEPVVPRLNAVAYFLRKSGVWPYLRKLAPEPLGPRLRPLGVRSRRSLQLCRADRVFLTEYYRDDITQLGTLLNRNLSAWLEPEMRPE